MNGGKWIVQFGFINSIFNERYLVINLLKRKKFYINEKVKISMDQYGCIEII